MVTEHLAVVGGEQDNRLATGHAIDAINRVQQVPDLVVDVVYETEICGAARAERLAPKILRGLAKGRHPLRRAVAAPPNPQ